MLNGWLLLAVVAHVIVAIIFICSLLYYHVKANTIAVRIATQIDKYLKEFGCDAAPFVPEWYNELSSVVKLDYPARTVCVVVISNADMFDKALPNFIHENDPELKSGLDCVDNYTKHQMKQAVTALFPEEEVDIIYDWELDNRTKLPKISMATAGHAAGISYLNRPEEVTEPSWDIARKMFGCSISPKYGGWFGFRAVLVFKNITDEDMQYLSPHDAVATQEQKEKLIKDFNGDWKDPAWRDVVITDKKYSEEQLDYFNTPPKLRLPKIPAIMERFRGNQLQNKKDD